MKIEKLRKIAEARTPGDWSIDRNSDGFVGIFYPDQTVKLANCVMDWDAEFIAMAANTYGKLLDVAGQVKAAYEALRGEGFDDLCDSLDELEKL